MQRYWNHKIWNSITAVKSYDLKLSSFFQSVQYNNHKNIVTKQDNKIWCMKFNSTLSSSWQLTVARHYGLPTLSPSSPPTLPISTSLTPSPPPLPPSPSYLPHRPLLSPCLPLLLHSPSSFPPLHQFMLSCLVTLLWLLYCTDWKKRRQLEVVWFFKIFAIGDLVFLVSLLCTGVCFVYNYLIFKVIQR